MNTHHFNASDMELLFFLGVVKKNFWRTNEEVTISVINNANNVMDAMSWMKMSG